MANHALEALFSAKEAASQQLRELEATARELRQKIKDYDAAIGALSGGEDSKYRPEVTASRSLKDIVIFFVSTVSTPVSADEILEYVHQKAGRDTSKNSLLSTLSRLTREGCINSPARGQWIGLNKEKGSVETEPQQNAGDVAERSIATDSKSVEPSSSKNVMGSEGSNPSVSAPFKLAKRDLLAGTAPLSALFTPNRSTDDRSGG